MAGRWAMVGGTVAAGLLLVLSAPAAAQEPASGVLPSCLSPSLEASTECAEVTVAVSVAVHDDHLLVKVANAGTESWAGGPVAVEVPRPGAEVDSPIGYEDPSGHPGTFEWVTRDGVVVSRCEFPIVGSLAPGGTVTCRLARLGMADGEHRLWLTGFVGGSPALTDAVDDEAPTNGVVAVAASRSVRFAIDGDRARVLGAGEVLAPPAESATVPALPAGDGRGTVVALGGLAAAAAAGLVVTFLARSRGSAT